MAPLIAEAIVVFVILVVVVVIVVVDVAVGGGVARTEQLASRVLVALDL